jgi:hypothetical protein
MSLLNAILILGAFVLVFGGLIGLLYLKWIWPYLAVRKSPSADVTLIKARLGGDGHRVVDVVRTGREITDEYRSPTRVFRIYSVAVEYPDGAKVMRNIGVACTLMSAPYLVAYENGARKPLWTQYQASLP